MVLKKKIRVPARVGRKLMRKYGGRRRRVFRPVRSVPDWASLSVQRTLQNPGGPGGNFTANTMFRVNDVALIDYDRAVQVAAAYQHYRIKKVTLMIKPSFDTFQQAAGNPGKMRLYYMIDKGDSIPANATLETLKQCGAKPLNLDEKPIKISWRPSVLNVTQNALGTIPTQYRISPFLSTNGVPGGATWIASAVPHKGVFFYVDQIFGATLNTQYQVDIQVEFQFKKPIFKALESSPEAVNPKVALIDSSADGVVGGNA